MNHRTSYLKRRLEAAEELLSAREALSVAVSAAACVFDGNCPKLSAAYERMRAAELNYARIVKEGIE